MALTFVPSFSDRETEADLSRIDPNVSNTFVIYRRRQIVEKYVDIEATPSNFNLLAKALDRTRSEYFDMAEPSH